MEEKQNQLIEAYKNDTHGGDTPEETWNMFIDALEKGDVELASKYFVVEKQEEMANEIKIGLENGNTELFLKIANDIGTGSYYKDNDARFSFPVIEGGVVKYTFNLSLNPYTNKWKIESL